MPGRDRGAITPSRSTQIAKLREQRERRARENLAARELEGSLISLATLLGSDVKDPGGSTVGQLRDVVVRWTKGQPYPPVTGLVVRAGKSEVLLGARWIEETSPSSVRLRSSKIYVRALERHSGDVALAHDVLDRQVVDADGLQIVRPADVYLATPVLLTYILILANRRSVLGDAANGPVFRTVATVCVAVVGVLSAFVLFQSVASWL